MKKAFGLVLLIPLFFGCTSLSKTQVEQESEQKPEIKSAIESLSLDQKIGQLFVIRPGAIDSRIPADNPLKATEDPTTNVTSSMKNKFAHYPAGGFALFRNNISDPKQLIKLNKDLHALGTETNIIPPFIFVDEEGGLVARLAKHPKFDLPKYESMADIGKTGNVENAYEAGSTIGNYLNYFGFDADFAPIADVFTNPSNTVIGTRAFSSDPNKASPMIISYLEGLHSQNIKGCIKHFPGHGDTTKDSHYGLPETTKTWEELLNCEIITFKNAIDSGAQMIMTAHITVPKVTGTDLPATVSPIILTEKLRNELGFNGVIITDALEMKAISQIYGENLENACVDAFLAGADILLMPVDYEKSFKAMKNAVKTGQISMKRLDESVERILKYKNQI